MDSRLCSRGFTLVELLVSLVVLCIGLLGLAGLQNVGIAASHSSLQRSQASWLAGEMADLLRANRLAACSGAYNVGFAEGGETCPGVSGATRAQLDVSQWRNGLCTALGVSAGGSVQVVRQGESCNTQIDVRWDDSRVRARLAEGGERWEIFTYRTVL